MISLQGYFIHILCKKWTENPLPFFFFVNFEDFVWSTVFTAQIMQK